MRREPDISERIAILKSLSRAKLLRGKNAVVVISRLSSYQPKAAEALVRIGADVAVVGGASEGVTRVHLRAARTLAQELSLNLVRDVVKPALKELGGQGGGHETAAALKTGVSANRALTVVERIVKNFFKERGVDLMPV
jgi:nanoRNase/pAp phosphatase (c-di-AMP/oligoRNAs hydrolase)